MATGGASGAFSGSGTCIMMENDFITASANIDNLDPHAEGLPIALRTQEISLDRVMSNSFGFGGTNASLVMETYRS